MDLLIFGDIHQDWEALNKLLEKKADLYICHGDLSNLGEGLNQAGKILSPLKRKLWLLPGNHEIAKATDALCQQYGFFSFHKQLVKKDNFVLAGLGCSTPTPFQTPGEIGEADFSKALAKFAGQKNLCLICHNPPYGTKLDFLPNGVHVGSQAIRRFIDKNQPLYFFSGHLHENEGKTEQLDGTRCFSVGRKGFLLTL